jgi:hypothetical protein
VKVRQRPTPFSYWPAGEGAKREKLQSTLFASDPWFLIRGSINTLTNPSAISQSAAFLSQARDFYWAATNSEVSAAKPLLLYYSFLNLAKCFVVVSNDAALTGRVSHGLSEQLPTSLGAIHGLISIDATNIQTSAFARFAHALGETLPRPAPGKTHVPIRSQDFLAQILIGHRVFCQGEGLKERFVSIDSIDYRHDSAAKQSWLRMRLFSDDLSRLDYRQSNVVTALARSGAWRNVTCEIERDGRKLIEIEQTNSTGYNQRPLSILNDLSSSARPALWRSVTSYPPYRKYYVYMATPSQIIMNQLLSMYIATYYFGSITRYKPESFSEILRSPIGPFVYEFFSNQPSQFLYLMASEFSRQEVARAAIA